MPLRGNMEDLALLTATVSPDEKAWWLVEVIVTPIAMQARYPELHILNKNGRHRWQVITVNRNDRKARHITDMGDVSLHPYNGLNVPGLWENTVGELRDAADDWRGDQSFERQIIADSQGTSKLVETWLNQMERRSRSGSSVFGPGISIER